MGCKAGENQGNHSDNPGVRSKDVAVVVVRGGWVLPLGNTACKMCNMGVKDDWMILEEWSCHELR